MTYTIESIAWRPTVCESLIEARASEVSFFTSHHGHLEFQIGSKSAPPADVEAHIREAATLLLERYPEYTENAAPIWD